MSETALRLKEQILRLPEEDRLELAHTLWDSIDCPEDESEISDEAWIKELDRRAAEAKANPADAKPVHEVIAELRGELP